MTQSKDFRFVVVDLELTDRDTAVAHIVEWAAVLLEPEWFGEGGESKRARGLVRPPVSIPPETSAIHHIIDADVNEAPTWQQASEALTKLIVEANVNALVAHTSDTESVMLASLNLGLPWICTYKAALRVWPEAPRHSNEALRYWLGLGTGRKTVQAPHTALHDAEVTAKIFRELLKKASIPDMLKWTGEPALLPRCPIGQYRDLPWADVPGDFLEWILYKARDMREDIKFCARTEVKRRDAEEEAEFLARQKAKLPAGVQLVEDIDHGDIPF